MNKGLMDFQREVAIKHGLGNSLVTGHKAQYFNEAALLYAEYVMSAALKELGNEWVRVEDRLPENKRISDKEVELQLVIACSGLQGMDTYVCTGGKWYYGKDLDIEVDDITHWCNLPSPPKDK